MDQQEKKNPEIIPNQLGDFTEITGLTPLGNLKKEINKDDYLSVSGNVINLPAQEAINGKYFLATDSSGKKFFIKRPAYHKEFSFEEKKYYEPSEDQTLRYSKDLLESITGNIYTGRLRKVFNVKIPECKIVRINGEIFEIFEYIDGWDSDMGYDLEIPTDQPKQIQFAEDLAMMGIFQFLEGSPGDNNQIMQTGNGDIYLVDSCINMSKSYLDIEHAGLFDESAPGKYRYLLSNKELRAIQIQGLNKIFIDDKFMELLKGLTKERLIEILGIDLLQGEHFIKLVNQIHSRVTYLIDYITEYRKRLAPDKPNKSRFSWIWNRK